MLTMCRPFGALEYDSPCPHHFRGGLPCVVPTGLRATRCDFAARRQESNLLRDKLLGNLNAPLSKHSFKMGQREISTELDDFHVALAQTARSFFRNHDGIAELRCAPVLQAETWLDVEDHACLKHDFTGRAG